MDNPNLLHLIPSALQNKKEILFGNLPEIYEFHNRHVGTGGWPAPLGATVISTPLCGVLWHTHIQAGKVIPTLPLCVFYKANLWRTPPRSSISSFLLLVVFFFFFSCKRLHHFVHLMVISPGNIHFERFSCWQCSFSGKTLYEEVFLVFSIFVLYFCYHIRRHNIFDSTS